MHADNVRTIREVDVCRGSSGSAVELPHDHKNHWRLNDGDSGVRALVFDVLRGPERLPNALNAVPAHQAGSFDDETQRQFGAFLKQVTQGRNDVPLVFYCGGMQCWMSYNAALRASRLGYRQVLWDRGGLEAWKAARLPVMPGQGGGAR